jgi:hypothetical protein
VCVLGVFFCCLIFIFLHFVYPITALINLASKNAELKKNVSIGATSGTARTDSTDHSSMAGLSKKLFSKSTKAIVWGMQTRAVQSMLDFDFICR